MTQQKYRTHQGRVLDIGALILKNENTRAVGNMGVNARGDRIDADNRPIDSRVQQVNRQYRRQITNVRDEPVARKQRGVPQQPVPPVQSAEPPVTAPASEDVAAPDSNIPAGGLAAAIARANRRPTNERK